MKKQFKFFLVRPPTWGSKETKTVLAFLPDDLLVTTFMAENYPDWIISMFWPVFPFVYKNN